LKLKKVINILHLIAPTQFGGAERVLLNLIDVIDRSRFNLIVGCFVYIHSRNNKFMEKLGYRGIPNTVFWLNRTLDIDNIFRIIRFIQRNKIDIIHTHGYRSDILGLIAAKITRRPIISTIHGWTPIDSKLEFYQRCDRFALRFFDRLIPVSNQIRDSLIESGINPIRVTRLRNAIDIHIKQRSANSLPSLNVVKGSNDLLIGIVGRLSPEKDIPSFLQAASLLLREHSNLNFLIVGDGPERKKLEDMTLSLGLKDKVKFTGFVDEMDNIYHLLDLLVISSSTEGIPLVLLEAMKYAIPVVASNVGGIGEVVDDTINGLLISPGNADELVENIKMLIINKKISKKISRNAREKIKNEFNRNVWIKHIEKIYSEQVSHQ
jgi:glycosyltransferase involved in cell wall biosynthesis